MEDAVEEKAKQFMNVRNVVLTSIISALGFVLALFWNDAVRSAIEQILPRSDTIAAKFIAAVIVTIIVVAIIYIILKSQKIAEKNITRLSKKQAEKGKTASGSTKKQSP